MPSVFCHECESTGEGQATGNPGEFRCPQCSSDFVEVHDVGAARQVWVPPSLPSSSFTSSSLCTNRGLCSASAWQQLLVSSPSGRCPRGCVLCIHKRVQCWIQPTLQSRSGIRTPAARRSITVPHQGVTDMLLSLSITDVAAYAAASAGAGAAARTSAVKRPSASGSRGACGRSAKVAHARKR